MQSHVLRAEDAVRRAFRVELCLLLVGITSSDGMSLRATETSVDADSSRRSKKSLLDVRNETNTQVISQHIAAEF
jgi:hypothetical protein